MTAITGDKRTIWSLAWCLAILGCAMTGAAGAEPQAASTQQPCHEVSFEETTYTVCTVDLRTETIRLFWKGENDKPYAYLERLPQVLGPGSTKPAGHMKFATNGGMYHPSYRPVGLYVENGRELVAANTRGGFGNFHLKPNGIFFVSGQTAGVMETAAFLAAKTKTDFATQSGPMLVINGKLHPRFSENGQSRKVRNGVGIKDAHTVVFAISDDVVSFGEFGRLFLENLKCQNALYLDGSVSTLYAPALQRPGNLLPLGPMIGVFGKAG